jgi:hypothetical protein
MTEITNVADGGSLPRNGVVVPQSNGKASYAELNQVADHFIGGNKLENAPDSKVKDFVAENDGHTVITNVSSAPRRSCSEAMGPGGKESRWLT